MFLLSLSATCQVWTVSLKAGQSTYKGPGADCLQRPLRSRFRQQFRPGVGQHRSNQMHGGNTTMESSWLTFVNLGGLAGALSLIWQVTNTLVERSRRPRLRCREPVIFNVEKYRGGPDTFRFITLPVQNVGRKSALGCVARATAIPLSGQGSRREVWLHWADTPFPDGEVSVPVNIAPSGQWRLDVAFSRSSGSSRWLASHRALAGHFSEDAELGQGEYKLEIRITFEDGNVAKSILRLFSSQSWDDLNTSGWSE